MQLLAVDSSTVFFWSGVLLLVFVLARRSQKRIKLSPLLPVAPPPAVAETPAGHHLDAPEHMARWEVEMHEMTRDLAGQLDSKIVIVQHLLRDTEQATQRLEAAIARAEQAGLWQSQSGDLAALESLAETGELPAAAQQLEAGESLILRRKEQVDRLAAAGLSSASIADQLGAPLGEVELLLSLRSGQRSERSASRASQET